MGKSPSRKRYEEQNPVSSCRIAAELKEAWEELLETLSITKKAWTEQKIKESLRRHGPGEDEEEGLSWNREHDWTQEWFIETPEEAALMDEVSRAFMEEERAAYDVVPNAEWLLQRFGDRLQEHELLQWVQLIASKLLRQGANARSVVSLPQA